MFLEKQFLKTDFYVSTSEHMFILKQSICRFLSTAGLAQVCKNPIVLCKKRLDACESRCSEGMHLRALQP